MLAIGRLLGNLDQALSHLEIFLIVFLWWRSIQIAQIALEDQLAILISVELLADVVAEAFSAIVVEVFVVGGDGALDGLLEVAEEAVNLLGVAIIESLAGAGGDGFGFDVLQVGEAQADLAFGRVIDGVNAGEAQLAGDGFAIGEEGLIPGLGDAQGEIVLEPDEESFDPSDADDVG